MSANIEALVKKYIARNGAVVEILHDALTEQAEAFKGELQAYDGMVRELTKTVEDMQAAQSVPVVGEPVAYDLSTDYVKLLAFLKAGNDAAGFVTTDDYHNGDVVGVTRRGPYNIHIGVRGYSFASVYPFNSEDGSEEEVFIKACEFSRLKWIKPHHSIPAAELASLREKAAIVDEIARKLKAHGNLYIRAYSPLSDTILNAAIAQGKGE